MKFSAISLLIASVCSIGYVAAQETPAVVIGDVSSADGGLPGVIIVNTGTININVDIITIVAILKNIYKYAGADGYLNSQPCCLKHL